MANKLYRKTKAKMMKAQLDLSSVTVKALLVTSGYVYSDAHQFLSDVATGDRVATSSALTTQAVGSSDASFSSDPASFTAVTGSQVAAVILFHDTGTPSTSDLVGYFDTGVTGFPFTPSGADETISLTNGYWFKLG